jgi:DNA polymerase-4
MTRRIMHIDLDAFFVSVEQVDNPELRGKPVVVGGNPEKRGVVAAASYEARAFGLHSGMPLVTASRLCPQAIFIEGSFPKYRRASQLFMAVRIKKRVRDELGLSASIGIAGGKVVAKVASELSKPDGLLEVAAGEESSFLAPLEVAKLPGVGRRTEQILKRRGLTTIGKLASAPSAALRAELGVYGEVLHRHANGIDERRVMPPAEAKSISRETTFAEDTRDRARLKATLRYLSERVGSQLREQGKEARCIVLKLRYADFTTISRHHTLSQGTSTDQDIFEGGYALLEKALSRETRPVRLIGIGVSGFTEPARQMDMLKPAALRQEQLNKTIDRIRKKYGFRAIQTVQTLLLRDIFPEGEGGYTLHTPGLSR